MTLNHSERIIETNKTPKLFNALIQQARKRERKIYFPEDLKLTNEQLEDDKKGWGNTEVSFPVRDTGQVRTVKIGDIADIDSIVPTGTYDAPKREAEDCIDEVIIICDVMAMSKGKYGNMWFLALCADPDADSDDENKYFTLPFGGMVSAEKLARIAGFNVGKDDEGKIVSLVRNEDKQNRLPIRTKVVRTTGNDNSRSPYIDLVSADAE